MEALKQKQSGWAYYTPSLVLATLTLWLRVDHLQHFAERHLWAEDGNIFITQAHALGWKSLFEPYAGYYHLYPRIVSMLADNAILERRPFLLLIGWLLAYYFSIFCATRFIRNMNGSIVHAGIATLLISLQPNNGEVFFNITNSQWHIGAALCFLAFTPTREMRCIPQIVLGLAALISGLTGPFSIVVLAVALGMLIPFQNRWKYNWPIYIGIAIGALTQALTIIHDKRMANSTFSFDPTQWLTGLWRFLSLGADKPGEYLVVVAILCCSLCLISRSWKKGDKQIPILALLAAALCMGAAGMYAAIPNPLGAAALGAGQRYAWIPYSLILTSVCATTINAPRALTAVVAALGIGYGVHQISAEPRSDLNFRSFARLAQVTDVFIPIHPVLQMYPSWNAYVPPSPKGSQNQSYIVAFSDTKATTTAPLTEETPRTPVLTSSPDDAPVYVIETGLSCNKAPHIGIEMDMQREHEGEVILYWSDNNTFSETYSARRWHSSGQIKAQFAFPGFPGNIFLRVGTQPKPGHATIKEVRIYCVN